MKDQAYNNNREINISTDVLVVGGGVTGLNTAARIADIGYRVILVENGQGLWEDKKLSMPLYGIDEKDSENLDVLLEKVKKDDLIEVLTHTKIAGAVGVPGDFHIKLSVNGDNKERVVGAVVAATDFTTESLHEAYGLVLNDAVWPQTKLENILGLGMDKDKSSKQLAGKSIMFLVGFAQEGNPIATERVLKSVLAIEEIDGCSIHVCVGNMKVAEDGLDELFKKGRDKGASFYKLSESPRIDVNGKKPLISFFDPVLRENVELETDTIVIEEALCTDRINKELAGLLRIDLGPFGFLQKDNVHRFPVKSNREGIFVVGPARDTLGLSASLTDMGNVILELKHLLGDGDGKKIIPAEIAVVDREKCAICLTCYRCCPHGAIYWDDKAIISPVACQACGTCAAECPQDAIQINNFKDEEISGKVVECCGEVSSDAPLIVAFCCRNSAVEAGRMAELFNMKLPEGLRIITVPCAGKIDVDYILTAFNEGADGVLVVSCHKGNCKSETGNMFAEWRVNDVKRMLVETGIESERISFESLASNMGPEFSSIANSMEEKIKEIGTSPLKKVG